MQTQCLKPSNFHRLVPHKLALPPWPQEHCKVLLPLKTNMAMGQWENSPFEDAFPIENGEVSNVIVCVQGCIFCFFVWSWYIFLENNLAFEISRWSIRSTCCLLYSTCSSGMLFVMLPSPRTYHVSFVASHRKLTMWKYPQVVPHQASSWKPSRTKQGFTFLNP